MNFNSVKEMLINGRTASARVKRNIMNNTTAEMAEDGQSVKITLHDTVIAELFRDGSMYLKNSGWHTATTVDRLNQIDGVNVCLKNKKINFVDRKNREKIIHVRITDAARRGIQLTDTDKKKIVADAWVATMSEWDTAAAIVNPSGEIRQVSRLIQ